MVTPSSSPSRLTNASMTDVAAHWFGRSGGRTVALALLLLGGLWMYALPNLMGQVSTAVAENFSSLSPASMIDQAEEDDEILTSLEEYKDATPSPEDIQPPFDNVKPLRFVFHVGPPKTGTTTLQKDFVKPGFTEALALDNYVYSGKETIPDQLTRNVPLVLKLMNPPCYAELQERRNNTTLMEDGPCWKEVKSILQDYRDRHTNVLLSSEDLSFQRTAIHKTPDFLHDVMETWQNELGFEVHVVLAYRRYAEWALSSLKQKHGHPTGGCLHRGWNATCHMPWQEIRQWMHRDPPSANQYVYTAQVLERWKAAGAKVTLLNFHARDEDDHDHITTKFFCQAMDGSTPQACQHAREQQTMEQYQQKLDEQQAPKAGTAANVRSSTSYIYDSIVVAAEQRGLLDRTKISREEATSQLAYRHYTVRYLSVADLPLICPTQTALEELLDISLAYEKQLLPELVGPPVDAAQAEAAHRAAFWRMANDKKEFCSVDTDAVLKNAASWEDLLDQL